jgi:N-acetylmuramoyl-L-alanine amidase
MALLARPLHTLLTAAALGLAGLTAAPPAQAQQFGQQPIDPNLAVAIATPVRDGTLHNLMILEQIPNRRQCWQEQPQSGGPVVVDPLLLSFDFTGACDRQTDGNGYSVRINGQDLGVQYRLEISARQNDLVLFARPTRDRSAPPIEIGRTHGRAGGLLKIQLNPGWQMARRTYNGQPVGHIYLVHDAPLEVALAQGSRQGSVPQGSAPQETTGQVIATPPPARPAAPPRQSPSPSAPPSSNPSPSGSYFRVIVPITGSDTLQRVRAVEPEAFRTTAEGQEVVQVGLFRDRQRADEIYAALVAASLPAKILAASAPAVASTPAIPSIPQGAVVVVIDPGHGGRDPGAVGIAGLQEKQINTAISNRVRQRLQEAGLTVLMTRDSDVFVDLDARAQLANRAGADLFVSIHANAISMSRPDVNGLETYYLGSGERLARAIHSRVLQSTDLGDRGVRTARFYVLRYTTMPAVLVETGFVTGATDAARFRNPAAVNQIADGIARGILDYLGR